jgi:hypothetical protein
MILKVNFIIKIDLFKNLDISKNPTDKRNCYFVLKLSFGHLQMESNQNFTNSLNDAINNKIKKFQWQYYNYFGDEINKILIKEDAISSFDSLTDFLDIKNEKLYVLIDEYDNSVNNALSN